jgi:hypothetical protein
MCLVPLSAFTAADLATDQSHPLGFRLDGWPGSELCGTGEGLPVPSHATTKRPTRMIIGVVVFAVGVLAGALIAAWVVPPA